MESFLPLIYNSLEKGLSSSQMEIFRKELADKVIFLLVNDFALLVQILYRIDIDESGLKRSLHQRKTEPAGMVIADMMIKRISNTIETKKQFKNMSSNDLDEDLKW